MVLHVLALAAALAAPAHHETLLGRSVQGRPIVAYERGDPASTRRVLVVGCIHGNECAGLPVIRRLLASQPQGIDLWLVPNLNPDGYARRGRTNAHGVDLNRNWSSEWRSYGRPFADLEYPGPRPFSEPESRIGRNLILRLRPQLTIWFHQPQDVVRAWGGSVAAARRYARLCGLPFRRIHWPSGSAPNWQNHHFPGTASFVVEFPAGPLSPSAVARQARAVLAVVP